MAPADVDARPKNKPVESASLWRVRRRQRRGAAERGRLRRRLAEADHRISAALIPFLEHDDANRALMGSNMQRQAVPLLTEVPPSSAPAWRRRRGQLGHARSARTRGHGRVRGQPRDHRRRPTSTTCRSSRLNERTCQNQKPVVRPATGRGRQTARRRRVTAGGELALGKNALVAFMTWRRLQLRGRDPRLRAPGQGRRFTSIHIEEFDVEIRETKLGKEEFTRTSRTSARRRCGTSTRAGSSASAPASRPATSWSARSPRRARRELTPEEKLLHAIFGKAGVDVKNAR